jgi:methyltransferase
MLPPPRRPQHITVALPASLTLDIPHLREKTARIGQIGRALAIFRVEHVMIYMDQDTAPSRKEALLVEKILKFQETPPYLRRELFPVDPDLAFTGILPPLRTANHPDKKQPETGSIRDAILVSTGESSRVNAGFLEPVTVNARLKPKTMVTIRLKTVRPGLEGEIVDPARLAIYWGLQVTREQRALGQILKRSGHDLTISTSRKGTDIREVTQPLREIWKSSKNPIIIFGSPAEGVQEILARTNDTLPSNSYNINTIPGQGTETVRTEEAVLGTLAVLNVLMEA